MEINTVVIGTEKLQDAFYQYMLAFDKENEAFLKQQGALLAEEVMRRTPPYVSAGTGGGNTKADQKMGIDAVKRQLINTVTPASMVFTDGFRNASLEKLIKKKKVEPLRKIMKNWPSMADWDIKPFSEDLHTSKRVYGNRFRPQHQKIMTLDEQKWKRYLRKLQQRVGYMKAGWGVAMQAFGKQPPAWIKKHIGYARGRAEWRFDTEQKYIMMENSTPTIGRHKSSFDYAVAFRHNKMENDIKAKVEYLLKKHKLQ